jgi:hypothetical protein
MLPKDQIIKDMAKVLIVQRSSKLAQVCFSTQLIENKLKAKCKILKWKPNKKLRLQLFSCVICSVVKSQKWFW